jgi:FMN phosphatase YigB (HAD superfamily)
MFYRIKNKRYIFVDYFDTLVFRSVHSSQVLPQWANVMSSHYKDVIKKSPVEWLEMRRNAKETIRNGLDEVNYHKVMAELWKELNIHVDQQEFIETCLEMDIAVELGCQYPNRRIVNLLRKAKDRGQKVILVSDFYLPESAYQNFFKSNGLDNLFDQIYISEACQVSKKSGKLYQYVLEHLKVDPKDCVMLGEQKIDDQLNAEKYGISGIRYFPFRHKVYTNLSRIFHWDYSKHITSKLGNRLRRHSLFGEYALSLFFFEERLVHELKEKNLNSVSFFARGGYLLKHFFEIYNHFYSDKRIQAHYCYISRKVVLEAEKNSENYYLLKDYLKSFVKNGQLVFVDEGWYCHSQQKLAEIFHLTSRGYYLGIRGRDHIPEDDICHRKGVLFDIGNDGMKPTKYYGILCTNCSLYEQMLTAPEGSVVGYERKNGNIIPILEYNEIERMAYRKHILEWQHRLELTFRGLCAWLIGKKINEKQMAKVFLKADLFNSSERCQFLNEMDKSMVDNCQNVKQVAKSMKDVHHISILDLILHPDMYLNQICKIQRKIYKHPFLNAIYKCFAVGYKHYVKILMK